MKKYYFVIFSLLCLEIFQGKAQIISTVAGNGVLGFSGDGGQATSAEFRYPLQVAFDASGNTYIADPNNNVVHKIEKSTGIINIIAGNGYLAGTSGGYSGDGGQATDAELYWPTGIALDLHGNIYITDYNNNRVREVNISTGVINTIAGIGTFGFSGDGGQATSAELYEPYALAFDTSGNMYISDEANNRIRKVTMFTGIISTIAGNGNQSYSGDGGQATTAELAYPAGITLDDSGNVFIADCFNNRIRKITERTGVINTIAGNGTAAFSGDGGQAIASELNNPVDVKLDASGNIYVSDRYNNRIREVTLSTSIINTIAGNGITGYTGDGGQATAAELNNPGGLEFDASGNIYFADELNSVVRKISLPSGIQQIINESDVLVYPNPCKGIFTLSLSNVIGKCNLELFNVLGQKVNVATQKQVQGDNLINFTGQPSGVYFFRVISESGMLIWEGKFVVQL
jgi:sugar lactone lactonase YvrE